jgi:hypothetical protein
MIENRLQDDAFWMFVNDGDAYPNTRIDFLFDLLVSANALELDEVELSMIDKDDIHNFRYLSVAFEKVDTPEKLQKEIRKTWEIILRYFDALEEWYSDLKLYHYVGFLSIECSSDKRGRLFLDLLNLWTTTATDKKLFIKELESRIDAVLGITKEKPDIDFDKVYDSEDGEKRCPKKQCRPILLFHNIMTVIKQNEESEKSYAISAFERFPFHLYRKEKGWDVEHIASNTENQLVEYDDQREWLVGNMVLVASDEGLTSKISEFLDKGEKKVKDGEFDELKQKIYLKVNSDNKNTADSLEGEDKNRLWNFALLDSGTNRSYGNALFPAKRNFIIARTKGIRKVWSTELKKWEDKPLPGAFVPICTHNAFLKTYTPDSDIRFMEWDNRDAQCYRDDMKLVFKHYFDNKVKEEK